MHSVKPDQYYTDVIARPIVRKVRIRIFLSFELLKHFCANVRWARLTVTWR